MQLVLKVPEESKVPPVPLDQRDIPDPLERLDNQVTMVLMVEMVIQVLGYVITQ